jgi:hypothetical protein
MGEKRADAVELAGELAAEELLEPLGDTDDFVGVDALPVGRVEQVLGGGVAGGPRSEGAAADAADGGVEDGHTGLDGCVGVGVAGVACVVQGQAGGSAQVVRAGSSFVTWPGTPTPMVPAEMIG